MNKRLKQCPVCNSNLDIIEYHCSNCDTSIKGKFGIGDFALLSVAQQEFAKIFLCCGGNIKEVEKELKISYPTVKNKLAEITSLLCAGKKITKKTISPNILDDIENGNISVAEALAKIKERK